jgi:hypothetical protein
LGLWGCEGRRQLRADTNADFNHFFTDTDAYDGGAGNASDGLSYRSV